MEPEVALKVGFMAVVMAAQRMVQFPAFAHAGTLPLARAGSQ